MTMFKSFFLTNVFVLKYIFAVSNLLEHIEHRIYLRVSASPSSFFVTKFSEESVSINFGLAN